LKANPLYALGRWATRFALAAATGKELKALGAFLSLLGLTLALASAAVALRCNWERIESLEELRSLWGQGRTGCNWERIESPHSCSHFVHYSTYLAATGKELKAHPPRTKKPPLPLLGCNWERIERVEN